METPSANTSPCVPKGDQLKRGESLSSPPKKVYTCLEQTREAQPEEAEEVGVKLGQVARAEVCDLEGQGWAVEALGREPAEQVLVDGFRIHSGRLP